MEVTTFLQLTGLLFLLLALSSHADVFQPQCGSEASNSLCPNGLCCSSSGWCGTGSIYCGGGCQSQCGTPEKGFGARGGAVFNGSVQTLITRDHFDHMFKHMTDCGTQFFYTYDSFLTALQAFPNFATTANVTINQREIAAFFAQISHETSGGWLTAIDGPYAWGFCIISSPNRAPYCNSGSTQWPCAPGKNYYGRGPFQLKYNDKYGPAGKALGLDLLGNPDLVAINPIVSFKTALWVWTTPQAQKPSAHDVMTGKWQPSPADRSLGRFPGFGLTTNIINGDFECGHGPDLDQDNRIGFYKRYCDILGVTYGRDLDCASQKPF